MRRTIFALFIVVPVLLGQTSERHVRFSTPIAALTEPSGSAPETIAFGYLSSSSKLQTDDLSSIYLAKEYTTQHNGVNHLVYRQRFYGIDVHNGAWSTNIGRDGAVLSAGGTLYPSPSAVDFGAQISSETAVVAAVRQVNPRLGARYKPSALPTGRRNGARFSAGDLGADVEGRLVWYAHRGTLLPAWLFNVVDEDGVMAFDVAIEASTGAVISKAPTTFLQAAPRGLVFDQGSPQPNPTPGVRLNSAPPLVERALVPLAGDPVASPKGWIINNETAGYNTVVGQNVLGQLFQTNAYRTQAVFGSFNFPVLLGVGAPNPVTFSDAANVNLFYWVNRAHDLFYANGFTEAAGNFQSDNYGRGGVGDDALMAFTHFAAAGQGGPSLNNAFFTTRSVLDGGPSMIAMFVSTSGPAGFFADGAYAADVIVHEYTHGVSLRLLPDGYGSFQTSAMGEAWSDFFGLEFTLPQGGPVDGSYPTGEYFFNAWGTGLRTRPYSTDTTINPLTFANLGRVFYTGAQVHSDGEIWMQAMWEARANLIRQFGETEGRRRIRQLVVDGLMLSPPSPTMVDARDAILLADQVDFEGASQAELWSAFAKRGLGATAHSDGGDTLHVVSSFEAPSSTGKLKFYEDTFVSGEPIRVILNDTNLTEPSVRIQVSTTGGDVEDVMLERTGMIYVGLIPSSAVAVVGQQNGLLSVIPGDVLTASYTDTNPLSLVQATAATMQPYTLLTSVTPANGLPTFANETRLANVRAAIPVPLPFEFPFFDKKYRSMVVHPSGVIVFQPSLNTDLSGPGCNDVTELRSLTAIAPLFVNMTFGNAQPNEGIFMGTPSPNSVSIRWTAETLPAPALLGPLVPEPVNVAVTITSDGLITFHYGAGNQNLHTAAQTLSTCGQPTVGISNGHDVYARTFNLRTFNNAPNQVFIPPFGATSTPEVILERPAADETVRGILRVSGIAYETAPNLNFVSRRGIYIDGIERGVAVPVVRPDYCAATPVPGCPSVGFQSELNLATLNLSPGPHKIFVRATNSRGGFKDSATVTFNVDAGQSRAPVGAIESPAAGAEVSGTAMFRGYAYAPDLRVLRVDLLIDGVTYPSAIYGIPRPDVCGALSAPLPVNCPGVGWSLQLNTRSGQVPLPDGPHSMQLRVLDETGRFTMVPGFPVPFTVKNGTQPTPAGAITSIRPNDRLSGVVNVSGYAYTPTGQVVSVILIVDGVGIAVATYGQPRPEECSTLKDVAACPNIGFSVNLDTRLLPNGPHVVGVFITNDSGISVVVPNQVVDGMNVTVDNR